MKIEKPYKRIIRPFQDSSDYALGWSYWQEDLRNAPNMMETIRSYNILEKDLIELFEYIEPVEKNFNTFSHRIYELFLRACTEFEANAKWILKDNRLIKDKYNIVDYFKLNKSSKLSEYIVFINSHQDNKIKLEPFKEWEKWPTLKWYKEYNEVKHNRHKQFEKANFWNLLLALSWLYVTIFSQFYTFTFSKNIPLAESSFNHLTGEIWSKDNLFTIILPQSWKDEEMYNFNWDQLKKQEDIFQYFQY